MSASKTELIHMYRTWSDGPKQILTSNQDIHSAITSTLDVVPMDKVVVKPEHELVEYVMKYPYHMATFIVCDSSELAMQLKALRPTLQILHLNYEITT